MTDMQSGYLEANSARLYYETAGAGHPLVFVHAGIADGRMWDYQFQRFADRYRVLRFDMRGFGRSDAPPGPASTSGDLAAVLDSFDIEKTYLVGCSMGGSATLDYTLDHPDRVDALILVGAGVSGLEPEGVAQPPYEEVSTAAKAGDLDLANELEMRIWVDGVGRAPDQVDPAVRSKVSAMNRALYDRDAEINAIEWQEPSQPAAGRLEQLRVPTLVIVGDRDQPVIAASAQTLAARVPGARLVMMPNTAHVPNMEQPEEFNRIVLDFLSSL
ncbi:MAG TPA: alpha/beta hydrolase [Ktedonobacterales bacterium]|jgi:pimeloyl-ACP methyl ester carboxylesterase|nr:alpha/beta hydrolase [Ktedonobacterales bacterium]